jgi:rhodanese-related sulfurtransferase
MRLCSVVCAAFAVFALACAQSNAPKTISADELEKLLERKDGLFFLDVREPGEIERLGSVKGYVNIPLGQLEARLKEIPKDKLIVTL